MRLSKLKIENFRGIQSLEIEFDRDITVLIGENNSGKTTVMEALRFGLDVVKSDKTNNFSEFDFYRDKDQKSRAEAQPIILTYSFLESKDHLWEVHITQALNDVIVGSDYSAIKLRITATYDVENESPIQSWCFLDDADNEMMGKQPFIKDLRKLRPFFFQTALRAAKDEFHGQSTYWSSFLKNKDIDKETRLVLEKELLAINQKIVDAHSSFKDVANEVKRISELVATGKADSVSIDPTHTDIFRVLRYNTEVNLLTGSEAKIPVYSHGEGTQSLCVLLLFSAYLKSFLKTDVDKFAEPIIAIEEPEAHLHPNAIRAIWNVLKDLPGQKVIATHSGDILSEVPIESLRRMNRSSVSTCHFIQKDLLTGEELRKFNHHVRRNRGELLFAKSWLIVEGETDVSVFAECADILGINLHRYGVRIVECSQAGGPGIFIKVADVLGIHWHLVADADEGGEKYLDTAVRLLNGKKESDYISKLSHSNIDILLCCNGYGEPYRAGVGTHKEAELSEPEGTLEFWTHVYKIINKVRGFSKPAAALEAIMLMKDKGTEGVPKEISDIIFKIICFSGGEK